MGAAHPDQRELLPLIPARQSVSSFPDPAKFEVMCASWDRMRFVARVALWRTFHNSVSVVGVLVALGLGPEGLLALGALPTRSMVKPYISL